jgi:ABC-type transporter Mla subunit MlaD
MPVTAIPEVTNHSALLAALAIIRMEVEARQEDVRALAAGAQQMAARTRRMGEELKGLEVDNITVGNINAVADAIEGQAAAAIRYASQTDATVSQAEQASRTAVRNHGAIEEAVNDAPVPMAKPVFYTEPA